MIFENKVLLAPLAGITDIAFRLMCKRYGAGMAYSEMVSAKGLQYNNTRTHDLLDIHADEGKIGVQLFGHEPETLGDIARRVCDIHGQSIAIIDINMGCPAPKIVKNGDGCALMQNIVLAGRIIESVKKSVSIPVSVKFRKGIDEGNINAVDFAKMAQDSGADVITVHGRTLKQFYEGTCDIDIIKKVKRSVGIPVVGNGDIMDGKSAKRMLYHTGCDAIMVARGALGNPFVFEQISHYLDTGKQLAPPSIHERFEVCLEQARIAIAQKGERIAIKQMRKHAAWYVKGIKHASKYKQRLVRIDSYAQLHDLLEQIEKR